MFDLQPFIFWVGFREDDEHGPYDDRYHNYQCIILAHTDQEANAWGKQLAQDLIASGEAVEIERTWIEILLNGLLTTNGLQPINWLLIDSLKQRELYQRCADCVKDSLPTSSLNICIQANSREQARELWQAYLQAHLPDYAITTCSAWFVPVITIGRSVEW